MKKPFKPTNPRSVNGAARRGWHIVVLNSNSYRDKHNVSYVGLVNWSRRESTGYVVSQFLPHGRATFAFEDPVDAFWFESRWT